MQLRIDHPQFLWLLALAVPMVWIGMRWFGSMTALRRWTSILVRVCLIALLVGMLAGVSAVKVTNKLAVVALVDVSGSARRFFGGGQDAILERARAFLAAVEPRRSAEDLLGLVVFDGKAAAVATPSLGTVSDRDMDLKLAEGTNIADAIRLGRAMIPPDASGRLLLFTDGNQTAGDAVAASAEGGVAGTTPIDIVPLRYRLEREVVMEQVDAPPNAASGAVVSVRVLLSATGPATGTLRLTADETEVDLNGAAPGAGRRIQLHPGANVEQVQVRLDDRRVHRFRAVFEPDTEADGAGVPRLAGDVVTENNSGEAFTLTPGRGTVLLVDGVSRGGNGEGLTVAEALRSSGFTVVVTVPEALPGDVLSLQEHDLVILEDVPADAVAESKQVALAAYVQDLGGGLVMIGGPNSFGAGGWKGSKLEAIMPVRLDLPERLVSPEAAIVFVLDNSGSMMREVLGSNRSQQEIANDAAALAVRSLDSRDLVGVIAFNSEPEDLIPLGPNVSPGESARKIRGIMSGGGTNALPAMTMARDQLAKVNAKVKHVVLLTDGKSREAGYLVPMARQMAEQGIKVSTIAVGDDADLFTMRAMAEQGQGTYYPVLNPNTLPQVFLKAVRVVRSPLIREEPFEPVILPSPSPMTVGLEAPPVLGGLALTQARGEPTVINAMSTPGGEPVLAHWQVGLGQVVAFTSDASEWAADWIGWDGYQRFWTQVARSASRSAAATQGLVPSVVADANGVRVRLEASDKNSRPLDGLSVPVTIYGPSGRAVEASLDQIGPGIYEGAVPANEVGSYVAVVKPAMGERRLSPVIAGATLLEGPEFRAAASNDELLRLIATRTGGRELEFGTPRADAVFDRAGVRPREAVLPLWPVLLWWTLGVALLDIATRRIAWDRWFSRRFLGEAVDLTSAAARDKASQAARTLSGLRARAEVVDPGEPSLALGKAEADLLVAAARDRRRAAKLGGVVREPAGGGGVATVTPVRPAPAPEPEPEAGGLLAAKRRAAKRFEEKQGE